MSGSRRSFLKLSAAVPALALAPGARTLERSSFDPWVEVRPDHGTVVVLLGSAEHPDTALGNPRADEGKAGGLSAYLDTRFWDDPG